jgi:flagellar motor component MotA
MARTKHHSLTAYRRRLKQRGVVRLEVNVQRDDAPLVRKIVKALSDPQRETQVRALLHKQFDTNHARGLKELLAAAPLDGVDLSRSRSSGRDIEL